MIVALLTLALATAGEPVGWRQDGTAHADASPPADWTAHEAWRTPLGGWSNGSPLFLDGRLYVGSEPTELVCLDAGSGTVLWRRTNAYLDTVPASERAAAEAKRAELVAMSERYDEVRRAHSRALRDARRAGGAVDMEALDALRAEVQRIQTALDEGARYLTPPDPERIGFTSATPVSDGEAIYVVLGNGVVSRFLPDGTRTWSRWLGDPPQPMRGHDNGSAATPIVHDGVLVVPFDRLRGLDAATGKTLWEGPAWRDYGSPALTTLGGEAVVLTPDGHAHRVRDGKAVAGDLGNLWFVGPATEGTKAWYAGGTQEEVLAGTLDVRAWDLSAAAPAALWTTRLPFRERLYAPPTQHAGRVHLLSATGRHVVLDQATGAVQHDARLNPPKHTTVFANATVVGEALVVSFESGDVARVSLSPPHEVLGWGSTPPHRGSPLFVGERVYVRVDEGVIAYGE